MRSLVAAFLVVVLASSTVLAQPGATPAPPPVPPPTTGTTEPMRPPVPPPPPVDPGRKAYDDAFAAMVQGHFALAATGFDSAASTAQDPTLAGAARELARLAREYDSTHATLTVGETAAAAEKAEDRDQGRSSFVVWTTMYSIYGGAVLIDDAGISSAKVGVLVELGATAAGLLGSIFGTAHRKMTGPMADAYSLGMIEGFANAGLLIHPIDSSPTAKEVLNTLLLSGAAGAGVGLVYGDEAGATRGQISFAGTTSLLGIATVGLSFGITDPTNLKGDTALLLMTGGLDAGLVGGLYLGRHLDWSTSRARLVQLGALVGAIGGGGAGFLATGTSLSGSTNTRIVTASTLAGMWGGFVLAAHFTRNMRPDSRYLKAATSMTLAPMSMKGGGGLSLVGTF